MFARKTEIVRRLTLAVIVVAVLGPAAFLPNGGRIFSHPLSIAQPPPQTSLNLNVTINGAGGTLVAPLMTVWQQQYHAQFPNTTINYAAVGSGAGRNALFNKTVDFAGSDAPLSSAQRFLAPGAVHIPEVVGSAVLAYNIPGIPIGLNLTGAIVARIYLGTILNWSDPQIQNINHGFTLPNHRIITVHRSDSSGTTFVFTSWLTLDSPTEWATSIGVTSGGPTFNWPGSLDGS